MKKKIGIITFHQCINYGAILQTFALQKVINDKNGVIGEVIDYRNKVFSKKYSYFSFCNKKKPVYILYNLLTLPFWIRKKIKFNKFIRKNIKISPKMLECQNDLNYDKYIVGSDQVWNHEITGFDKTYFLDFVKDDRKKYSYAASFGFDRLDEKYKDEYKRLLKDYNKISVRESQGKEIINDLLNIKVPEVLDPTLLLRKEEWANYCNTKYKKEKYILIYQLAYSKRLISFAKKLSKETNLKIITIDGNPRQPIKSKYVLDAGPQDWLGLFYNAEYIVTNSFHGLVFSVNFNKKFYLDYLGNNIKVNSRLENFVKNYQLENRLISANMTDINKEIPDYNRINKQLELQRDKSFEFIESIIGDK